MSPALAGGFFTAEPPGKLPAGFLFLFFFFRVFQFRNLWVPEVFQVLSAGLGGVCLGWGSTYSQRYLWAESAGALTGTHQCSRFLLTGARPNLGHKATVEPEHSEETDKMLL